LAVIGDKKKERNYINREGHFELRLPDVCGTLRREPYRVDKQLHEVL